MPRPIRATIRLSALRHNLALARRHAPKARILPPVQGRITFEDVSFSYDSEAPVLQNVSLDVKAGEILALAVQPSP